VSEHDERFGSDGPLSIDPEGIRISMKWGDWDEDFHPVVVVSPPIESRQSYSSKTAPSDDDHWGDIAVWVYLLSGEGDLVFLVHDDSMAFADHFPYQVEDEIGRLQSQQYADELGIELGPASGLARNTSTPVGPIDPGSLESLFGLLPDNFMSPPPECGLAYGIGGGIGCGYYKRYDTPNHPTSVVSSGMCNGDNGFAMNTTEYSYALEFEWRGSWDVGERSIGGAVTGTGHTKKYLNMNGVTW